MWNRSLVEVVWERAATDPNGLALVEIGADGDTAVTWSELVDSAERLASHLSSVLGVQRGECVLTQLPNSAEFVIAAMATLRIGGVCTPVLPSLREHELSFILARSRARVLFIPAEFRGRRYPTELADMAQAGSAAELAHLIVTGETDVEGPAAGLQLHHFNAATSRSAAAGRDACGPEDVCHLLFTSGTTGEPKAVPHRMSTLNRTVMAVSERVGLTPEDRLHIASPMAHHSGFLYGMWLALLVGQVQIVQARWDAQRALAAFAAWQGTFMQGATPFLLDMVTAVEDGTAAPTSLRMFVVTGAAVSRPLAERARSVLGVDVCAGFGSTETCMATLSAPSDPPEQVATTDGRPLDDVQLRIVGETGRSLLAGQEGELEISGPYVFDGYLDRPDLTADAFTPDGWYRTGDLAVLETTGHLRITGRLKDVINRGGEKIPAGQIEQLLLARPDIRDAAIVGMPDPRFGERACLFVVPTPGASPDLDDVQAYLDGLKVSKHFWPERVEVVDALPRNPAGKVQKYLLREEARQYVTAAPGALE